MHIARRKAKFAAWYQDPNDNHVLNPFGKFRAPSTDNPLSKAENGHGEDGGEIKRTVSDHQEYGESNAASRKSQFNAKKPAHADTEPSSYSKVRPDGDADGVIPIRGSPSPDHGPEEELFAIAEKRQVSQSSDTINAGHEMARQRMRKEREVDTGESAKGPIDGADGTGDDNDNGKKKKRHFTAMGQIRATILNSWINILLIFSPVGIAVYYAHINPIAVFVINFIAIIPLAAMLSYATEEIALRTGETLGGLLNASFGNAVELIVSVIALTHDQVLIVQTSLIGSILSNLLLVLGMCFFFGGFNRIEQAFNMTVAQTASSLLFLAVSSLIIPTAFHAWSGAGDVGISPLSRGTAVLLLFVYGCYLFFQLKSHADMYNKPSDKNKKRDLSKHKRKFKKPFTSLRPSRPSNDSSTPSADGAANDDDEEDDKPEEPQLSIWVAVLTLCISTVLVAFNAEYLVDSINAITCGGGLSKTFVGLILLPIVGNAAEHATAVTVAIKDKMDLAIGVAVGSSMQIALLVLPFVVVLGWILGKDNMTLYFDGFQIAVLFVAVLLVNYLIQDGKSHWLEGVLLQTLYIIIAVAAWFYPTKSGQNDCPA